MKEQETTLTAKDYMKQKAQLIIENIDDTETIYEILSYCEYLEEKLNKKNE